MKIFAFLVIVFLLSCKGSKKQDLEISNQRSSKATQKQIDTPELKTIPHTIITGKSFFNNNKSTLVFTQKGDNVEMKLNFNIEDSLFKTKVFNKRIKKYLSAERMEVDLEILSEEKNAIFKKTIKFFPKKRRKSQIIENISLESFEKLSRGKHKLSVNLKSDFETLLHNPAHANTLNFNAELEIETGAIYQSTFYFKSMDLNSEETNKILGENDLNNANPEACIVVYLNDEFGFKEFSKNSYSVQKKRKATFYHSRKNPPIRLLVKDADYGINQDDLISDTILFLEDIKANSYKSFKFSAVDDIQIYCETKGVVN